jgi:hypothetical protein
MHSIYLKELWGGDLMKCHNCGKENINNAEFCENCGSNLNSTVKTENEKKPSGVLLVLGYLFAILGGLIGIIIGGYLFTRKTPSAKSHGRNILVIACFMIVLSIAASSLISANIFSLNGIQPILTNNSTNNSNHNTNNDKTTTTNNNNPSSGSSSSSSTSESPSSGDQSRGHYVTCALCGGSGEYTPDGYEIYVCPNCGGTGIVWVANVGSGT